MLQNKNDLSLASYGRLPWIDSLRGIAILCVMLIHCAQVAHSDGILGYIGYSGQYGVQLFFVASAITISLTYHRHSEKYGTTWRADIAWLIRRFYRIAPMYYVGIIFYSISHYIMGRYLSAEKIGKFSIEDVFANIIFIHTWVPSANNSVVPGGWTIGVEMMFYAVVPLMMLIRNTKYFTVVLGLLALAGSALTEFTSYYYQSSFHVNNNSYLYFWFPAQVPVLLMGCMFFHYKLYSAKPIEQKYKLFVLPILIALSGTAGLYLGTIGDASPALAPPFLALSFCCIGILLRNTKSEKGLMFIFAKIGQCSFSMYIIHFAILDLAKLALMLNSPGNLDSTLLLLMFVYIPVSFVTYFVSCLTYKLIEVRFINMGHRVSAHYLANSSIYQKNIV